MSVFVWTLLGVLAAWITLSGLLKLTQPKEKLGARFPWMHDAPHGLVWFIGVVEILGAIGLIVPRATGIAPILTPLAAAGLAILMLLATGLHLRRKETAFAMLTTVYGLICVLTAWLALR
ncbi:DoxX family protein [Micromonospora echinaurantiaca]|uniref:DoxX family protein n=1 Tax=Micromonospora echinaurantiaca TaxID=47857 RepID=UPI0037A8F30C